jgi:glutamate---cysteine ligase / carboxylate-amine ligase
MRIDFHASQRSSLGVEWELQLVDRRTRQLVSAASEVLAELGGGSPDGHPKAKHELFESTIEVITGVCGTVAEARADLAGTIGELDALLAARGLAPMCAGTHPFSDWRDQQLSPNPRYARLVEDVQWPARRLLIFGVHVHVGVRSAEKAIAIANAASAYIPHFLAMSASSPYWKGSDSGLASSRSKVFETLPTAGLPYQLSGWPEFEQLMTTLISAKAITSIREIWWDIRPHPDFGTVELRICDGLPRLTEISAAAALSQCLVEWMDERIDRGDPPPVPKGWVVRENKWKAARYGLDADIIVDDEGALRPVRHELAELVDRLAPVAARLECTDELAGVLDVLAEGPSARRQREVVAAGGTMVDVVDALIAEFATDRAVHAPLTAGAAP